MGSTEQRISELEDKTIESTQSEHQRENRLEKKIKQSLGDLWEYNAYLTFMSSESQKERRNGGAKQVFEDIIIENFPKLTNPINIQIQEVKQSPNRISTKKSMPRQINQTSLNQI